MGKSNTFFLCMCNRNCIIIIVIINIIFFGISEDMLYILYIIIIVSVVVVVMFQNRQLIVTSLGYCWNIGGSPQSPILGVPATSGGKWVWKEMESDSDINIEDVCERMAY